MSNYDFTAYTEAVINAIGPKASPRVKQVFPIMIRKMHEFCIEADVTMEEWMDACNLMVKAGQISSDARNEVVLVTDVFGIESLVDTLDQTRVQRQAAASSSSAPSKSGPTSSAEDNSTFSAILGPFYRSGVPVQPNGSTIIREDEGAAAPYTHLFGVVHGADGKPLANALVDVWHDAPDGLYDSQTPEKAPYHCRGRFRTDAQGRYETVCLKPTPYPIPFDHQAGALLTMMDRHPYRPAHIHFWIEADGHKTLVTQLFDSESKYLDDDSVFAVKDKLIVNFKPVSASSGLTTYGGPADLQERIKYQLEQNFHLQKSMKKDDAVLEGGMIGLSIAQSQP